MAGSWTNNWEAVKRIVATNMTSAGDLIGIGGGRMTAPYSTTSKPSMPMDNVYDPGTGTLNDNSISKVSNGRVSLYVGQEQSTVVPSPGDTTIFGPITSGISYRSVVNGGITYNAETGIATRTDSVTIQNMDSGTKTVYEWGLFGLMPTTSAYDNVIFLLYRGTLDEPVTLRQYETITITFTRRMQIDVPNSGD